MKLKNYLLLLALLLVVGSEGTGCHQAINILNVNSVEHGYRLSMAQFRGIPTERLKQILISQLNSSSGSRH